MSSASSSSLSSVENVVTPCPPGPAVLADPASGKSSQVIVAGRLASLATGTNGEVSVAQLKEIQKLQIEVCIKSSRVEVENISLGN